MPDIVFKLEHLQPFVEECANLSVVRDSLCLECIAWVINNISICRDSDALWCYGTELRTDLTRYIKAGGGSYDSIDFLMSEFYELAAEIITLIIRSGFLRNDGMVLVSLKGFNGEYLILSYQEGLSLNGVITRI
jgi:hypothetical protein